MTCLICDNIAHAKENDVPLLHFVPLRSNRDTARYLAYVKESYDAQYHFGGGITEYRNEEICHEHQRYLDLDGFWVMPHNGSTAPPPKAKETEP